MTAAVDLGILEAAHAADSEYIVRQYSTRGKSLCATYNIQPNIRQYNTGYQTLSFVAPIAYTGYALVRRRPWSIQQTLRATWLGGIGGAVAGAGTGWAWATSSNPGKVHQARVKMSYDVSLWSVVNAH
jgi:hypothetical protein